MKFAWDDGGRKAAGYRGNAGDCVVRAVAIASGRPYQDVYNVLSDGCRNQRTTSRSKQKASARNSVNVRRKWFRDLMVDWGFAWTPCMGIGTGCQVHLADSELPAGRLVVAVSKHYTAVIDRVIHDTHDPQRQTLIVDNGVQRFAGRCVYGFWEIAD